MIPDHSMTRSSCIASALCIVALSAPNVIGSHFYVARLPEDPAAPAEMLWVWRDGFGPLTASFTEFVERYVAGDEAVRYGFGGA